MTYGINIKNWFGAEPFEGTYGRASYLFVNIPDYYHHELGMALGGIINLTDVLFLDIAVGFAFRYAPNEQFFDSPVTLAGNFDMSFGIKIK